MKTLFCSLAVLMLGCAASTPPAQTKALAAAAAPGVDYGAIVSAADRSPEDQALDAHRKPVELLAFFAVGPGARVAELGAGGGYTTELLARTVGPTGAMFSQNPPAFLSFAGKPWTERLAKPALKNVARVERPLDDPLPPEAINLDLVVIHAVYHDAVWSGVDRDKMNRAVFAALKPGGAYVVVDSSAKPGTGAADAKTLHRIDEQFVIAEVQRAGFKLASKSDAWRNPDDTRDWSTSPGAAKERRGTGDRFALRFVK